MNCFDMQRFLANSAFSVSLALLIFYWFEAAFLPKSKYHNLGVFGTALVNLSLTLLLVVRWVEGKHFPLSNLYESLVFLSWSLTSVQLLIDLFLVPTNTEFVGVVISPIALLTNAFSNFTLPAEMQRANSLVPALQSNWLMMHVTIMMLSYVALIVGSLFALAFLVFAQFQGSSLPGLPAYPFTKVEESLNPARQIPSVNGETLQHKVNTFQNPLTPKQETTLESLDSLSYRVLGLGFPLLTVGILSGSVWANEAWGSYWSWDPKETWAFITWLVYAIYLHTRITKGWTGTKPAIIATIGFVFVWMCYLGVNLISKGLHTYGWVQP